MRKLITAYREKPTYDNARKLRNYASLHPMALCVLTDDETSTLRAASEHVARG